MHVGLPQPSCSLFNLALLCFLHFFADELWIGCGIVHERTRSGNIVFNDVMQQLSVNELPFSGIGESGCKLLSHQALLPLPLFPFHHRIPSSVSSFSRWY